MIKNLCKAIEAKKSTVMVGLDPFIDQFPPHILKGESNAEIADGIWAFNKAIIDATCDLVPAYKPQAAFYEQYGWQGFRALEETVKYAKSKGSFVVVDGKRNDIGSTVEGYAKAFLSDGGMGADALTVNGYLGTDGIKPFLSTGKMIFVLVKTSNASSGELQDRRLDDGKTVYETMADLCVKWGADSFSDCGYSNVGIVVGATYAEQIVELRGKYPNTFFLIPGYGAQGGKAADIAKAFDKNGLGAIVSAGRSVLYAWKKAGGDGKDFAEHSRMEVIRMAQDLAGARK